MHFLDYGALIMQMKCNGEFPFIPVWHVLSPLFSFFLINAGLMSGQQVKLASVS